MELWQIKRAVIVLLMTTATVAYIQLISMERWSYFWHVRLRSPVIYEPQIGEFNKDFWVDPTPDINLVYFDADEKYTGSLDMLEESQNLDPEDEISNDYEPEEFEADENATNSSYEESFQKNSKNKFATLTLRRFILNETDFAIKPLMLLFSSWEYSADKELVHSTLRKLWKLWPTSIKPLVMTRDKQVQQQAKSAGWLFQTVTHVDKECYGPPVLSTLFTDAFKKHDAYFYGYSNADIVFGDGLEKTMKYIYYYFRSWKTRPVLVIGRRHNVNFTKYADFPMNTPENVSAITKHGQLVIRSTDYFFSNRHFPWGQAPKVSIGKVWVVRAIIGWALKKGYVVIDATRTIQAIHLTTKDGVFASWHKQGAMCNERILASLHWSIPTAIGHCECARLETFHGTNGEVRIRHRPPSKKICTRQVPPSGT